MTATIMGDDAVAMLTKKEHLRVPSIGVQRPSVREHDGFAPSPILVVDLCAVGSCDRGHCQSLLSRSDRTKLRRMVEERHHAFTSCGATRRWSRRPSLMIMREL